EKLYCPPSQKKLCGCLQKFIKTSETQDAEIAEGSGKRKKTVSEHPSKSQSPPAVSHPPAVPASTGHMVVQGRAQTHTSRESELPSMQSIDGMEMCEIEASPSIEEMIRVAESDAGNIPLGRMEYRPHSRTGLLAESDMANQQGKHDFRPLVQTGLVPRSDIVTNQVQKLEYRPLSQTGLVADNELINQKYRPQIQADTETGSVASQPEYVAQNQT
ncbi:hypothetical protein MAR_034491, partial [Mya arenaria]